MRGLFYVVALLAAAALIVACLYALTRLAREALRRRRAHRDHAIRAAARWEPFCEPDPKGRWVIGAHRPAHTSAGDEVLAHVTLAELPAESPEWERLTHVQRARDYARQANDPEPAS